MSELVKEIAKLESKAQSFDDAVERIMKLRDDAEIVRSGEGTVLYLLSRVDALVDFYELSSRAYQAQIDAKGYHEASLKKYSSSTFKGELIDKVIAHKNREVFVTVEGNSKHQFVGMMSDGATCFQSPDYIMCDVAQNTGAIEGFVLQK